MITQQDMGHGHLRHYTKFVKKLLLFINALIKRALRGGSKPFFSIFV